LYHFQHLSNLSEYIRSFGYLAPMAAFLLFVIQAALPIFPYAILVAAAVILFGAQSGFLLALLGALLGSVLSYWGCRVWGAEWFNRCLLRRWGYDNSQIDSGIAFGGIVLAHLVQVVPNSVISLAAAVSGVTPASFAISTMVGLIPATVVYTGLGWWLYQINDAHIILHILAIIGIILVAAKILLKRNPATLTPPLKPQMHGESAD
jgi:uncharacterized membrane protein YdjX (TVP38/TMEM64 family)